MVRSIKLIFLIILLCWPIQAVANIFDPVITDLSVEYLGEIFGGNIGSINLGTKGTNNPFFGELFQIFNGVILAVATFILTYIGTISIMHTAHEGEVMGKKWSSIWIPLRSAAGLLLMAPVPGNGYSLLQVTVMWIIINGIGAADKMWNLIVDNLAQGISPAQVQALDSAAINKLNGLAQSLGPSILKSLICLKVVQDNIDNNFLQQTGQILGANFVDDTNSSNSGNLFFGVLDSNHPENITNQSICGKIKISTSINVSELDPSVSQDQLVSANSIAYQAKKQALSIMITEIKPVADEIVTNIEDLIKNNKPPALPSNLQPGLLFSAVGSYANLLAGITKQSVLVQLGLATVASASGIDDMVSSNINTVKSQGWISAGAFYFMLSRGSAQGILATANEPFVNTVPNLQNASLRSNSVNNLNQIFQTYSNILNSGSNFKIINALFNNPISATSSTKSLNFIQAMDLAAIAIPGIGIIGAAIIAGVQGAAEAIFNGLAHIDGDPLLEHARLGYNLMISCEFILLAIIGAFVGLAIALAWGTCIQPIGSAISTAVIMFGVPLMGIATGLWVFGATLGIYTPMIPYMMFAITALSWMMLVIEAIVAAPIVALGLVMPAQEELGSLHAALGIIANIFLRPMLMLIGLIMAIKIFTVMIKFISFGFISAISVLQQIESGGSLFSCVPITALYVGLVIALENKCFGLIYQVPDKILRWIGISPETTDVASVMQEAQKTYETGANKTAENIKDVGAKVAEHDMKKIEANEKDEQDKAAAGGGGGGGKKAPTGGKSPGGGGTMTPTDPSGLAGKGKK